jgi:hypothetical protein
LVNSKTPNKKFTDIKSKYKLIVLPAGVLNAQRKSHLKDYYQHWQEDYDLEVVLISLDTDPIKYAEFIHDFPGFPVVISRVGPGECQELLRFGYTHDVLLDKDQKILHKPFCRACRGLVKGQEQQEAAKALV